jgi:hypothetical protein
MRLVYQLAADQQQRGTQKDKTNILLFIQDISSQII